MDNFDMRLHSYQERLNGLLYSNNTVKVLILQ